jgi:hypothetical protein
VLGADLPEAERNRLLRRVDWRFLLPISRVGRAASDADGDLRDGLGLIAGQVVPRGERADGCDVVVAVNPADSTLGDAWAALRPGGVCYVECAVAVGGVRAMAARLRAAGFADARAYLPWPSPARPYVWVPIHSLGATRYFWRHLHARTPARELAGRFLRLAVTLGARLGLIGPQCFVARKAGPAGESDADPALVRTIRTGWARWGLDGEPGDIAILLLTRGPRSVNKIAGLVFRGGDARPHLVVKIARVLEARPGLLREATTLPGIETSCLDRLKGAPRVLFTVDDETGAAVGETALPGAPMLTFLRRSNYRAFAIQATDWLIELARCTRRDAGPTPADPLVAETLAEFRRSFGSVIEPALLARTAESLVRLGRLARVCEHRDFAPWNVFVAPRGGLAVLDWESSEPAGVPGLDLHYFLTYLAFGLERAKETPAMLRSYRVLLDPSSFTGGVHRECLARYAEGVGLEPADVQAGRLLTWLIHARSEHRRLTADAVGPPPDEVLQQSLFLGLWRLEAG